MTKVLNCNIIGSEFKPQLLNKIHFLTNALEKIWTPPRLYPLQL